MRSEDSREREKKHSSSASPNSILSPRGPKLSLSLSLFHPTLPPWNGVGSLESRFQRFLFVIFIPRPLDRGLFLNRFKSWYSVTTRGVVTRPGLRSRPPRAREPRLAATSAVWRTSGLRICWWTAPASRAAAGRTSPANFSFRIRNLFSNCFFIFIYIYIYRSFYPSLTGERKESIERIVSIEVLIKGEIRGIIFKYDIILFEKKRKSNLQISGWRSIFLNFNF